MSTPVKPNRKRISFKQLFNIPDRKKPKPQPPQPRPKTALCIRQAPWIVRGEQRYQVCCSHTGKQFAGSYSQAQSEWIMACFCRVSGPVEAREFDKVASKAIAA